MNSVARKLLRSILAGDPADNNWFEEALEVCDNQRLPLDRVIWDAVREVAEELKRERVGDHR